MEVHRGRDGRRRSLPLVGDVRALAVRPRHVDQHCHGVADAAHVWCLVLRRARLDAGAFSSEGSIRRRPLKGVALCTPKDLSTTTWPTSHAWWSTSTPRATPTPYG